MTEAKIQNITPERVAELVAEKVRRKNWEEAANYGSQLPQPLTMAWVGVADEIAFCASLAKRPKQAIRIYERAWAVDPGNWRRASAIAYVYYDAALGRKKKEPAGPRRKQGEEPKPPKPFEDLAELREGFRRWIGEALALRPDSVKDLYRLGVFEAQIEARKDKLALRAFLQALEAFETLPSALRTRGDMVKYRIKILYAGARSALRLGQLPMARKLSFQCIREDPAGEAIERIFQLGLAGKVCLATGENAAAERAFRLALDLRSSIPKDYLFGYLAESLRRQQNLPAAAEAITSNLEPPRRPAFLWRLLGDIQMEAGKLDEAEACFAASAMKDRMGRHLTLLRIGRLELLKGDLKKAEQAFRKAQEARRRMYQTDHREALEGLAGVLDLRGLPEEAAAVRGQLSAGLDRTAGRSHSAELFGESFEANLPEFDDAAEGGR